MYEYNAALLPNAHSPTGVVDGDTMHVLIDLGMEISFRTTLRVYGINAPEMSTQAGKDVKQWVIDWFRTHCPAGTFMVQTVKDRTEKFGRYLAVVIAPDSAIFNDDIVAAGMAVPYFP